MKKLSEKKIKLLFMKISIFLLILKILSIYITIKMTPSFFKTLVEENIGLEAAYNFFTDTRVLSSSILLLAGALLFIKLERLKKTGPEEILFGIFFAFVMFWGMCCKAVGTVFFLRITAKTILLFACACFYGWYYIATRLVRLANWVIRKCIPTISEYPLFLQLDGLGGSILKPAIWIVIFWLPYIIIRYPGGIGYDEQYMIRQFLGYSQLSSHWPVFTTILMGSFIKFGGCVLNSYEFGIFLFVVFQSMVSALVFSYTINFCKRINVSVVWRIAMFCIYAFVPLFPGYFTSVCKDSLYALMVLMIALSLAEILLFGMTKGKGIQLFTVCLLTSLLRNNGIYIIVILFFICFIHAFAIKRIKKKKLWIVFLFACVIYVGYADFVLPYLGGGKEGLRKGSIICSISADRQIYEVLCR